EDLCIDDVGAFSQTWDHHIKLLDDILHHLHENVFTFNSPKCEWSIKETDRLGYWLTPRGLKPWKKKMMPSSIWIAPGMPLNCACSLSFVNYYKDMWPSHSHILKPLTDHSGLKKRAPISWTPVMHTAFDKMHALMAADTLAAYPNHNKWFDVYTNASDYQLGACIVQKGRPVAHFSRKLSKSQQNYMVMEKDVLSIVTTLDKFCGMLLGSDIHVFTNHKNLIFDTSKMQPILRWHNKVISNSHLYCTIMKPPHNILADNLSRLHHLVTPAQITEGRNHTEPAVVSDYDDDMYFLTQEYSDFHENDLVGMIECYLNLLETPHPDCHCNPLHYTHI
ncbi:hypothetical protein ACHAW6_003293, partial [Cyclotella cf. meneghiniana]